jgi:microcystin degradation protein MlrC
MRRRCWRQQPRVHIHLDLRRFLERRVAIWKECLVVNELEPPPGREHARGLFEHTFPLEQRYAQAEIRHAHELERAVGKRQRELEEVAADHPDVRSVSEGGEGDIDEVEADELGGGPGAGGVEEPDARAAAKVKDAGGRGAVVVVEGGGASGRKAAEEMGCVAFAVSCLRKGLKRERNTHFSSTTGS